MPPPKKLRETNATAKQTEAEQVPEVPEPEGVNPTIGTEVGQEKAARYLPYCVRLFAGVAFSKNSKAKLHTRVVAAGHLVKIAGGIADEVPEPDEE